MPLRCHRWAKQTLLQQNVLDLVGNAADGARPHLSLSADAPVDAMKAFRQKFEARFKSVPDHNAISSYTALYALKAAAEKAKSTEGKAVAQAMHGMKISAKDYPNTCVILVGRQRRPAADKLYRAGGRGKTESHRRSGMTRTIAVDCIVRTENLLGEGLFGAIGVAYCGG